LTQKTFSFEVNAGTPLEKGVRLISLPSSTHFKFFKKYIERKEIQYISKAQTKGRLNLKKKDQKENRTIRFLELPATPTFPHAGNFLQSWEAVAHHWIKPT
jgi:hypothetical protein